jgi:hypothetical protein
MEDRPNAFYIFTFKNVVSGRIFINGADGTTPCKARANAIIKMEQYVAAKPELGLPSEFKFMSQEMAEHPQTPGV